MHEPCLMKTSSSIAASASRRAFMLNSARPHRSRLPSKQNCYDQVLGELDIFVCCTLGVLVPSSRDMSPFEPVLMLLRTACARNSKRPIAVDGTVHDNTSEEHALS